MQREQRQKDQIPSRIAPQLEWIVETCRMTAIDQLGIALPPLHLEVQAVATGEALVRTDQLDRILVHVGEDQRVPDRSGRLNLVHALTREIGRLVIARRLPPGALLAAPWDDAFALHLATSAFIPDLIDGAGIEPGHSTHRGAQVGLDRVRESASEPLAIEDGELSRCLELVARAAEACGGSPALLRMLPQLKAPDLGPPRIDQTLTRLGT